jgi:dUTP pyrophosphatase
MGRSFAVVSAYRDRDIRLPGRKTERSAGYDVEAAEAAVLPPGEVTFVPTGLKAYMNPDEVLQVFIRSVISTRNRLSLVNGTGIIDADYADNPDNEGHIMIAVINHGPAPVSLAKGQAFAQAIFTKCLAVDGDAPGGRRTGGFGSTDNSGRQP